MKKILFLILAIFLLSSIFAQSENAGTAAFQFFNVPIGPRGVAMANAYLGLANDELAPFWNPAGLPQIRNTKLGITYLNYLVGFNGGAVSYVIPVSEKSTMAIFSKFCGANDFIRTYENGEEGGKFSAGDVLLGISYGKILSPILNFGFNIKFISETLDDYNSQAIAADIGIFHQTTNPKLKLGIVAKNIGKQLTEFDIEEEKLPMTFAAGFAYNLDDGFITIDVNKPMDNDFYGAIGIEKNVYPNFIFRCGYKTNANDWHTDSDLDFAAGFSAGFGFGWQEYHFDYAINSLGELGFIHQISVRYNL